MYKNVHLCTVVQEEDAMAAVALASSSGLKERVELPERFFLTRESQRDVVYLG
jgi:hypothetical protein